MKFLVKADSLKKVLSSVPALVTENQILLTADATKGCLTIEAGHNGVYLKQVILCDVETGGFTVLNSNYLSSLKLGDHVELQKNGNALSFKSGKLSGRIETHQSHQKISDQRPQNGVETSVHIAKDILVRGVQKTNFSAIIASSQEGLRVKFDDHMTLSNTDSYRLSLYKMPLPFTVPLLDFLVQPDVFASAIAKVEDQEVGLGVERGVLKVSSPSFEFYHPVLQTEPTDVEGWIRDLDPNDKICEAYTNTQDLLNTILSVGSITKGGAGEEVNLKCKIKGKVFSIEVGAVHGSAKGELTFESSTADTHELTLSYRYTIEMLSLIKDGELKLDFYEPYVILTSKDGRCLNLIPTKVI